MTREDMDALLNDMDYRIYDAPDGKARNAWRPLHCAWCRTPMAYPLDSMHKRSGNPECRQCGDDVAEQLRAALKEKP
jgi:hypothetical protein